MHCRELHWAIASLVARSRTGRVRLLLFVLALLMNAQIGHADNLPPLNVKYQLRGYCYAGSRDDKAAPGGYGASDNAPRHNPPGLSKPGSVTLLALPDKTAPFARSNAGFRLLLINGTKSEQAFEASDSRLTILQEALDAKGQWRPIEYFPRSDCGNSFHRVFLPPRHHWQFTAAAYTGKLRTRLRFVLRQAKPIYSNEFEGSINVAQFTKKQGYRGNGLMDPYSE